MNPFKSDYLALKIPVDQTNPPKALDVIAFFFSLVLLLPRGFLEGLFRRAPFSSNQFKSSVRSQGISTMSSSNSQGGGERNQKHFFDRTFTLHFRPSRQLTRSNAVVVPKTPEQHLDLPTMLQKTVKISHFFEAVEASGLN